MFKEIRKKLQYQAKKESIKAQGAPPKADSGEKLSVALAENLKRIQALLHNSNDLVVRRFSFGENSSIDAALVYIDGLASASVINTNIIEPLMYQLGFVEKNETQLKKSFEEIKRTIISVGEVKDATTLQAAADGFISGDAALLIDGIAGALILNAKGWESRSVTEPATESVIRGPREGFTENLRTNTALIRRRIKSPALTTEMMVLGNKTRTPVCLAYISGVANEELLAEMKKRLKVIDTDAILESGYIEQFIEDAPFSVFSTMGYTEKPDVVAAKLLEGRVAILVDGTPFVLTAPMLFIESFQSAEDYYVRPIVMSMLRFVRFFAFVISVLAPALYVAVTTFHQELLPTNLLFTMVAAREDIPFPAVAEAAIMLLAFEILREAGIRLPRPVGQAMSIVGALIMGDAAVSAGLIGAPMVIVIAITAVSIFAIPTQSDSAAILRLIFLVMAGWLGGYGVVIALLAVIVHLAGLKSFGFSYLSPIAPLVSKDLKDAFVRFPLWKMRTRPNGMAKQDSTRQGNFVPVPLKENSDKTLQ